MPGEWDYIAWLRWRTPSHPRVVLGVGDDCAVLAAPSRPLLVTTDMLMDGTDFWLAEVGPRRAGRKAMAANLSDIAAMAGVPVAAVVSLALPQSDGAVAEELYLGLREMADRFNVPIVGGDTNSWMGKLVVAVTVLGEVTERGIVRRSGAQVGDWLFVTGPLGGSILGHHLDFTPRIDEALRLHECVALHAMIDISDGLAADVNHICQESGCGAVLRADAIPISPAAIELSRQTQKTPLDHALEDGEDFELVFAVSPEDGRKLQQEPPLPGLCKIGECVGSGLWLEDASGQRQPLAPRGWEHPVAIAQAAVDAPASKRQP